MSQWYYSRQGRQLGPVPESELARLAASGEIDPASVLVWRDGMDDWKPAGEVPGLRLGAPPVADPEPLNPYRTPVATEAPAATAAIDSLPEIEPGSQPLEIGACLSRAFGLTKRHFGMIIAVGALYLAVNWGLGIATGIAETLAGGSAIRLERPMAEALGIDPSAFPESPVTGLQIMVTTLVNLLTHVASVFLSLGITRIGLNLVSGRPFHIGMMFGEIDKLLRAVGASILYGLVVAIGLLLFIVPGVYMALRWGQYLNAMVDRDLGVFESFAYSSRITSGQKWPLLGLGILCFLIILAGLLAFVVGMIFAYPIAWLAGFVAYRWLQYGPAANRIQA